ncbi:MAG: site-2 protease family protein [Deltaproteobacteria bacterium]|nr:site-2 protease family protein [Deltaproteobacteria bacterium]
MQSRLVELLIFYPVFLFSLSVHEAAHGWTADRFGDSTAKLLGRVTLNPLPHMDMIGTLLLPIVGILTGAPIFGWGKPVPVDTRYFKHPRRDNLWVAIMGPISNITLAIIFAGASWGLVSLIPHLAPENFSQESFSFSSIRSLFEIFQMGVILNLMLAFFNMLPLPPLDGGSVLRGILPWRMVDSFDNFSRYSFFLLLFLFMTGLLRYVAVPVFALAAVLLPG